jgi:hypothetical protein
MTDTAPTPIVVNGSPTTVQLQAALRSAIQAGGVIAGTLGASGLAGDADKLLVFVGPVAAVIAFLWGQYATHKHATQAVNMANKLPPNVATTT